MSITSISRDFAFSPSIVRITATETLSGVAAANYLTSQLQVTTALNSGVFEWEKGDLIAVAASDGSDFFNFVGTNFATLVPIAVGNGNVSLPVVAGDFAVFNGTSGALYDAGYLPTNAAKTHVSMLNGAVIANHIAVYSDTAGTIDDDAATAINAGNIQAGLSGVAGELISYPATGAKGSFVVKAVENTGNTVTTLSNDAMGQATQFNIPDPSNAVGQMVVGASATPFVVGNIVQAQSVDGVVGDSGITVSQASIQSAYVNISGTGVTGAYAAPTQLIPTPGPGLAIVLISAQLITSVSTPFAGGGVALIQYGNTVHGAGTNAASATIAAAEINAASSQIFTQLGKGLVAATVLTGVSNEGLYFSNATGAFTGGAGTILGFALQYVVVVATV